MTNQRTTCYACSASLSGHGANFCQGCDDAMASDDFAIWWKTLKAEMVRDGVVGSAMTHTVSPADWVMYYVDGYGPREALEEDFANA